MLPPLRRWVIISILVLSLLLVAFHTLADTHRRHGPHKAPPGPPRPIDRVLRPGFFKPKFRWRNVQQKHPVPVDTFISLPTGSPAEIPKIQYDFGAETLQHAVDRKRRLRAVEEAFQHSWEGYKKNAWKKDEVSPLTGKAKSTFGDWGATLVDTLDTLWIMGMKEEFEAAVAAIKTIDFKMTSLKELNVFETTIRYLGGLLSAYDVSGHKHGVLLKKATELGDMLYLAFDTPNRMPLTHWDWENTALGKDQEAKKHSLLAEVGSLSLEFTRLSQLTGDPKWYDAVARLTNLFESSQNHTRMPGLWPVYIDTRTPDFTRDFTFTLGGMADSLYEYLPKQHVLLNGQNLQYQNMYLTALPVVKEHLFFRPLTPENRSMLLPGTVMMQRTKINLQPQGQHLSCFAGGMVALAAKVFRQTHDLETARELVDGCIWAYESMPSGIMPEAFSAVPCDRAVNENCTWDDVAWQKAVVAKSSGNSIAPPDFVEKAQAVIEDKKLAPGFTNIDDARYILRPEAIESVFILYRITGDESLRDNAWQMFQSINNATRTPIAYAALKDVRQMAPERKFLDSMESFWTAETLKYFYLIFSEPDVMSLDEYVLNTEAHPLLRQKKT